MDSHLQKAQHYRDQALKLREMAALEKDGEAKKALVSLSENYDRLCQQSLERVKRPPP